MLAALRDVLTRQQPEEWKREPEAPRKQPARKARAKKETPPPKKATLSDLQNLINMLDAKKDLVEDYALQHAHELFGPAILERKEWVMQQAKNIVDELFDEEPQLELPPLDAEEPAEPRSAFQRFEDEQRQLVEQHKQAGAYP